MSQKELATSMEVSPQIVNKWLRGKENFTFETIDKLERALGIRLLYIQGPLATESLTAEQVCSFVDTYDCPDLNLFSKNKESRKSAKIIKLHAGYTPLNQVK